ncbi:uncharacterized protein zgc:162297 isoform X3 [Hypanus sabinus]|uniref:uncharacterized protein zgc:162297 isoform X3 n=1 Tax=Hypanus sabinus TaxID=79690 RepID=UPI0028C43B51|nr:uncharacterized protein zgc:162297 isoform X3 [Hypanus sabinus]
MADSQHRPPTSCLARSHSHGTEKSTPSHLTSDTTIQQASRSSSAPVPLGSDNAEGVRGSGRLCRCRDRWIDCGKYARYSIHFNCWSRSDCCHGDYMCCCETVSSQNSSGGSDSFCSQSTSIGSRACSSSHAMTSDISVSETGRAAEFFLSDGVILTGVATGMEANPAELKEVKQALKIPVLIGSGVTYENMEQYMDADALIVGSHFKRAGYWANELDPERIKKFMTKMHQLRK